MYEWELWLNAKDANIIKIVNKYQQTMLIVPTKKNVPTNVWMKIVIKCKRCKYYTKNLG